MDKTDKITKKEPVADYISEGNPNTGEKILGEQLAQEIRVAIEKERTVSSTSKQNIDVTIHEGIVTLKGRVASEHEKMTVGDKAAAFAGFGKVENQLDVDD